MRELHFGRFAQLVMHAAQGALALAQRIVDLDEMGVEACRSEFALTKHAGEKAALVGALVELNDVGRGEGRRTNYSERTSRKISRSDGGKGSQPQIANSATRCVPM
jgi:hypothetical protein